MAYLDQYRHQVALLVRAIPFVATEKDFALKGGTAINLFVKDLPRLSVDIDLTYLPVADRPTSLAAIDAAMARIGDRIEKGIFGARVTPSRLRTENVITKLVVRLDGAQIKIEVTPVLRGTVYDPAETSVTPAVEEAFGFARMKVVSRADLYAGKLVAALDRQHPRDLFDVRELLEDGGIDDALRRAFIVYAISHDRPLSEILAPTRKLLDDEFARGFDGLTREPVALETLAEAREAMIATMVGDMPDAHRAFPDRLQAGRAGLVITGSAGRLSVARRDLEAAQPGQPFCGTARRARRAPASCVVPCTMNRLRAVVRSRSDRLPQPVLFTVPHT